MLLLLYWHIIFKISTLYFLWFSHTKFLTFPLNPLLPWRSLRLERGKKFHLDPSPNIINKTNGENSWYSFTCFVYLPFATWWIPVLQFSSDAQSYLTLCDPMDCSTPSFLVYHQLLELAQTHDHQVGDAIQTSHPLSSPLSSAFNHSQHQSLFKWVRSSNQVAKYWTFSFNISPSNGHSGLSPFRMDWLNLLTV